MDKYQSNLLNRGTYALKSPDGDGIVTVEEDAICFEQNENYAICLYNFIVDNPMVDSIKLDDEKIEAKDNKLEVQINFAKQAQSITLYFKNGFAEPCNLALKYVSANKEQYDAKALEQRKSDYLATMNLTCRTGIDLINVYWRPACPDVVTTTVRLSVCCDKTIMLMDEVNCSKTTYYKAFKLAYGTYQIEVSQKNAAGNELVSQKCHVSIVDPFKELGVKLSEKLDAVQSRVAASGRGVVHIG